MIQELQSKIDGVGIFIWNYGQDEKLPLLSTPPLTSQHSLPLCLKTRVWQNGWMMLSMDR